MTLRDYFAAKALKTYSDDTDELLLENAIRAYKQADAMIKARQAFKAINPATQGEEQCLRYTTSTAD